MTSAPAPLIKNQVLPAVQDFYELRRRSIGYIEELSSAQWTDYNVHDPGITILEAVSYAITDIAYRMDWSIGDILAPPVASADQSQPYPNQAFFTARQILTVNPVTPQDFRRLLIDVDGVRNAWITCKSCACESQYFAWCTAEGALQLSFEAPQGFGGNVNKVHARGLYDVQLALESDADLGDLNDRKIVHGFSYRDAGGVYPVVIELRFPDVELTARQGWEAFLGSISAPDPADITIHVTQLGATKNFDVFSALSSDALRNDYLHRHWHDLFYVSFQIKALDNTVILDIDHATLRLQGGLSAKANATAADWKKRFEDATANGILQRYRRKARKARAITSVAKAVLNSHRNLDEDYCDLSGVGVEEIAVCADVEVTPDADIERVQALIWIELVKHFDPPVRFDTLAGLQTLGVAVEHIFNGPELEHGFLTDASLAAADWQSDIRVSDVLNRLMDIPGVITINQLQLTKYNADGEVMKAAADPQWVNGNPVFDPNRTSATWQLFLSPRHQPRLYKSQSRFLFFKNGLPFSPRMSEAETTFNMLSGSSLQLRTRPKVNDLAIPAGAYRDADASYPMQYSLPPTYGVSPVGLPSHVSKARLAQANNLKAYLGVFDQLIGNALAQFAHSADLFSLDLAIARSYFVKSFTKADIVGWDSIAKGSLTTPALEAMVESPDQFLSRRNLFLDHLLARFGESFNEYALLLTDAGGARLAKQRLIANKIAFIKNYPGISHNRGKAFNHRDKPCAYDNVSTITKRVQLLLGMSDLTFAGTVSGPVAGNYAVKLVLRDGAGEVRLESDITTAAASPDAARQIAEDMLRQRMAMPSAYEITTVGSKFRLRLMTATTLELARDPAVVDTREAALARQRELVDWSSSSRMIVVEHLLLRPKFPGDALFPACSEGACHQCGDEDPYSFRLTYIMPGWSQQYAENLDFRRFAERALRLETPAHLLAKICWVGNDGLIENPCDGIIENLATVLERRGLTAAGTAPSSAEACTCASAIYQAFNATFSTWYIDKTLDILPEAILAQRIASLFQTSLQPADVACAVVLDETLWTRSMNLMVNYFTNIALTAWQFERFEDIWCKWLAANAAIDWNSERLSERVKSLLAANLETKAVAEHALCTCAETILVAHGKAFATWLDAGIAAGTPLASLGLPPSQTATLCAGMTFKPGTAERIAAMLNARYTAYRDVSFWLRKVVLLLSTLRSTYPTATLHDCDDGSDVNPVHLDNTALGGRTLHTTLI